MDKEILSSSDSEIGANNKETSDVLPRDSDTDSSDSESIESEQEKTRSKKRSYTELESFENYVDALTRMETEVMGQIYKYRLLFLNI